WNVTILDKSKKARPIGGGLQVNGSLQDRMKTAKLLRKLVTDEKSAVQLWSSIESRLRREAQKYKNLALYYQTRIEAIHQDENAAWAVTDKRTVFSGEILIGADGHRSLVRRYVAPHHPDALFAGYIVWI